MRPSPAGASPGLRLFGQAQARGLRRDPARTEPDQRRSKHAAANGSSRTRWRQRRADSLLRSSFRHRKPVRLASIPQRRGSPDIRQCPPKVPRHRPKSEFPIDQCPCTAGSFPGDFRTPAGVRNSSRIRNGRFGSRSWRSGHSKRGGSGISWVVERSFAWLRRYRRLNTIVERSIGAVL